MIDLAPIIKNFPEVGEVQEIKALTSGHINQTYLIKTADEKKPDYVLQRVNNNIFCDLDMLQHNIEVVTEHIRQKLVAANEEDIERKVLRFIPATNGKTYYKDETGYWRISVFIPESQTLEAVTPESSYLAGLKFGEFQAMLADIPEQLGEIIPNFHYIEFRFVSNFFFVLRSNICNKSIYRFIFHNANGTAAKATACNTRTDYALRLPSKID